MIKKTVVTNELCQRQFKIDPPTRIALSSTMTFAAEAQEDGINVGGSLRVNYGYREYDDTSKDKGGDFNFDVATIKMTGQKEDFGLAAEYRFTSKTNFIKFGYGHYKIDPNWELHSPFNEFNTCVIFHRIE